MQRLTEGNWERAASQASSPTADPPAPSWLEQVADAWFQDVILKQLTEAARDGQEEITFLLDSEAEAHPAAAHKMDGADLNLLGAAVAARARNEGFEVAWWPSLNRTLRLRWMPRYIPPPKPPSHR